MIDTIISIELEHRARQKALTLKSKIDELTELSEICRVLAIDKEDAINEYESITKDILDFTERKEKTETLFAKGFLTYQEAEYLIERDAFKAFFE